MNAHLVTDACCSDHQADRLAAARRARLRAIRLASLAPMRPALTLVRRVEA